jgi:hypothetical protein
LRRTINASDKKCKDQAEQKNIKPPDYGRKKGSYSGIFEGQIQNDPKTVRKKQAVFEVPASSLLEAHFTGHRTARSDFRNSALGGVSIEPAF